jgi:prepilin-type N-terminal cleavage/methylation domain-containing protein
MRKRGFTLIELLVVVTIIGGLIACGVMLLSKKINTSTVTICGAAIGHLEDARTQIVTDSQTTIYASIDAGSGAAVYNPNQAFTLLLTSAGTFIYESTATTSDDGRSYQAVAATEMAQGDTDWNTRFIPDDVNNIRNVFNKLNTNQLLASFMAQYPNITITANANPAITPNTPGNNLALTFTPSSTGGGTWSVTW